MEPSRNFVWVDFSLSWMEFVKQTPKLFHGLHLYSYSGWGCLFIYFIIFIRYPETREPLEQLEDALRRSFVLVNSCQDKSYLYLLAMGWNIVYQFRKAQNEIDRYLRLVPLITLVDNARVRVCCFISHVKSSVVIFIHFLLFWGFVH